MNRTVWFIAIFVALGAAQTVISADLSPIGSSLNRQEPEVTGVRLTGKKLWVIGNNFSEDATILVGGEAVNTKSDPDDPSHILIAKRGGKRIPKDVIVSIAVLNNTGVRSEPFSFFSGLTITLNDAGKTIRLKVGDKFQLLLNSGFYEWTVLSFDSGLINKLADEPLLPGSQGAFQAVQPGKTQFFATGQPPCHKLTPPCLAPDLGFQVTLVVG